jgi:hypothetical protein
MESALSTFENQHTQPLYRLREAAENGDERTFVGAVRGIRWRGLSATDFVSIIRLALEAGAYKVARDAAEKGIKYHPDDPKLREYSRVLAPARVLSSSVASDGAQRRSNREWLEAHGYEYSGRWVAVQDGELLDSSDSLEELVERIDSTEDVLLTIA